MGSFFSEKQSYYWIGVLLGALIFLALRWFLRELDLQLRDVSRADVKRVNKLEEVSERYLAVGKLAMLPGNDLRFSRERRADWLEREWQIQRKKS